MSIQQIGRELPSLAMGPQMFFLAISNNLPILSDQLQIARQRFKDLTAAGEQATPVWEQVLSSLFSGQTAMAIGVTILTTYGKDIVEWVGKLFSAKNATLSMSEAQQKLNAEMDNEKSVGKTIANLRLLQTEWNDLGNNLNAKTQFIKNNKREFDDLGVSVTNVKEAENLLISNSEAFVASCAAKARAIAATKLASEEYEKQLKLQREADEAAANGPNSSDSFKKNMANWGLAYSHQLANGISAQGQIVNQLNPINSGNAFLQRIQDMKDLAKAAGAAGDKYIQLANSEKKAAEEKFKKANITPKVEKANTKKEKTEEIFAPGSLGYLDKQIAALQKQYEHATSDATRQGILKGIEEANAQKKHIEFVATSPAIPDTTTIKGGSYSAFGSIAQLESEKKKAVDAFNSATDIKLMQTINREIAQIDGRIAMLKQLGSGKLVIDDSDLKRLQKRISTTTKNFKKEIQKSMDIDFSPMFEGLADAIGTALGSGDWAEGFKSMIGTLASMLKQFGALLISAGLAKIAFDNLKFSGWAAVAAGAALIVATAAAQAAMSNIKTYASGGIAYGPTLGIFGEYAGASHNPEVVAPLNKLKDLINPGGLNGNVRFEIQGRTLVGIVNKMNNINDRIR